jgi:hypothetical protein
MSKYDRLRDYLAASGQHEIHLSLSEIETIIGEGLPGSAELCQWWHNPRSALASLPRLPAWDAAGYEAVHPRGSDEVIFRRRAPSGLPAGARVVTREERRTHAESSAGD